MVCPSVTISLWRRGESTWSRFWAAMSSMLGVTWTAPAAWTFSEDREVLDRRHLNYSAYLSSNSRELISSSSPFEYSCENSGCVSPVVTMVLGAGVSCMFALMIVLPCV